MSSWESGLEITGPPARRLKVRVRGGYASFSAPAGVSDAEALADWRRMELAIAKGRSRKTVSIGGPPRAYRAQWSCDGYHYRYDATFPRRWTAWAARNVASHLCMWANQLWRATGGRYLVNAHMAEVDRAIADYLAKEPADA
ncbi:hypothetical protein Q0812_13175 [Brevundimonas sp. 2R-24]|uniref:Uncharacterized protein n=1 Tax=Peiella sedimenti TaxID=3061083 RepID=A0ABT8SP69_9CAUL|nr:hypothetical protein [Caulobacteraceae bacterium XZ-24]